MKWDFRHHLLLQIEMLRADLSHEELSNRLGDVTERSLARYIAGKSHLTEAEFTEIAKALKIDSLVLAGAWAASLGLRLSSKNVVQKMVKRAYRRWREFSPLAGRSVPSHPSPMAVIRAKYADRLSAKTPPLGLRSYSFSEEEADTAAGRARFARAYEMLVLSVHSGLSARDIGALYGISGERVRQLVVYAAHAWARQEGIDLSGKCVPFKNEARFVKNFYAGLSFFAQQYCSELAARAEKSSVPGKRQIL